MNLRHRKAPLSLAGDPKGFGQTESSPCKFEISQADHTIKLKRVTPTNAFKVKLKPFLDTNTSDKFKISLSGVLKDSETQLKRSLEQVYAQDAATASVPGIFTRSKGGAAVKKYNEPKTKIRKCVRNSAEKITATDNSMPAQPVQKEPEIVQLPILIAEEPYKANMKDLTRAKTKPEKRSVELSEKAPLYIQKLYEKIQSGADDQYKEKFFGSFKENKESGKTTKLFDFPKLPVDFVLPASENLKKDFIYDLDIITNQNQKEKIKVSFQPGKVEAFNEVPNPMYKEDRDKFFSEFNFTMDYRSGYAPIDVQAKQEKEFTYKNHFIKKKQSCANGRLKRVCGVSYVKKLECHQLNVDHIFPKLNPLVFQGSTGCIRLNDYQPLMNYVTDQMFQEGPGCYFIVTLLEAEDESLMREYLYFPERRLKLTKGKVYLMRSIDALWFFFKDKHFVCVHLVYDNKEFLRKSEMQQLSLHDLDEALRKSNVQIGILCKKGLSGKKSFLKTFTEGLDREGLGVDSDSDDDEDPNKEPEKDKPKEEFAAPKKKKRAEDKELKEKEKKEKKERREQEKKEKKEKKEEEKKEKQEQKEKNKKEKLLKLRSTKSANREKKESLTTKQLHFFDKCKLKLEKANLFGDGELKEIFANVDDIMKPYLKMLFIKGFTYTPKGSKTVAETAAPSASGLECVDQITVDQTPMTHDDSRFDLMSGLATPSVIPRSEIESEKPKTFNEVEEKSDDMDENKENQENQNTQMQVEEPRKEDNMEPNKTVIETEMTGTTQVDEQKTASEPKDPVREAMLEAIRQTPIYEFIKEVKKEPGKNMVTLSARIELYTHEDSWKSADDHTKNLLDTFILHLTDVMTEKFRNWTLKRSELTKANSAVLFSDINKNVDLFEYDTTPLETYTERVPLDAIHLNWHFDPEIKDIERVNSDEVDSTKKKYFKGLKPVGLVDLQGLNNLQKETGLLNLPLYIINTRDSFAFDLIEKKVEIEMCGRKVLKTDYYFDPNAYPSNFKVFFDKFPDYHVGVTTYTNFFTHEELLKIEEKCYETERKFFDNHFLPMTGQMTATNDKVRRTKFFFGARYMWTKQQLSEPHSMVGAGIRTDVSDRPRWMRDLVENPMVEAGILEKDFVNSIAMNVYHDGREGIAQHFDDAVRFKQPIFSLRIFSDSRLSFGSQFYGFCNGAFCIPMPRGCITVLAEESYAANGVKHCVRPCDMTGKSAAMILRQMHSKVFNEAQLYNEFVDFPTWFSTLSIKDNAVSYSDQKRLEADDLLKNKREV